MHKLLPEEMDRLTRQEFRAAQKLPLCIVLDNVRSAHNVGSVLRTADAFRLERVCLCGITACPPSNEVHKTALGAEESVDWKYYSETREAIEALRSMGYYIYCVEQCAGSVQLDTLNLLTDGVRPYALVFGHEVKGVDASVVDACDGVVEIPQRGTKHSLNVSVSVGILVWEFARQMGYTELV